MNSFELIAWWTWAPEYQTMWTQTPFWKGSLDCVNFIQILYLTGVYLCSIWYPNKIHSDFHKGSLHKSREGKYIGPTLFFSTAYQYKSSVHQKGEWQKRDFMVDTYFCCKPFNFNAPFWTFDSTTVFTRYDAESDSKWRCGKGLPILTELLVVYNNASHSLAQPTHQSGRSIPKVGKNPN